MGRHKMRLFKSSLIHALLCGSALSTASGDGSTTGDEILENWFRELSNFEMPEVRSLLVPNRHCYYCRSTEFSSGQDNVGGECFTPDPASTTFKPIDEKDYGCFTMYGYLKKSGQKVIYRTSAYSKSEENRCRKVNFRDFISNDSNADPDEELIYC